MPYSVPEDTTLVLPQPENNIDENIAIVLSVDESDGEDNDDNDADVAESNQNDEKIIADIIIITEEAHTPTPNELGILPVVIISESDVTELDSVDKAIHNNDDNLPSDGQIDEQSNTEVKENETEYDHNITNQHDEDGNEIENADVNADDDWPEGSVSIPRNSLEAPTSRNSQDSIKSLTFDIFHEIDKYISSPANKLTSISYHMVVLQHHALNELQSVLGGRIEDMSANSDMGFNG